jgi:hypothetical protein
MYHYITSRVPRPIAGTRPIRLCLDCSLSTLSALALAHAPRE